MACIIYACIERLRRNSLPTLNVCFAQQAMWCIRATAVLLSYTSPRVCRAESSIVGCQSHHTLHLPCCAACRCFLPCQLPSQRQQQPRQQQPPRPPQSHANVLRQAAAASAIGRRIGRLQQHLSSPGSCRPGMPGQLRLSRSARRAALLLLLPARAGRNRLWLWSRTMRSRQVRVFISGGCFTCFM